MDITLTLIEDRNMILLELLSLVTLFLTSQSQPVSQNRILTRMSSMEPLCDVHTSYIFPNFEKNIYGLKRKVLNGVIRQRVRIVKCLDLNAGWAIRRTVIAKCQQNFAEVKLLSIGKWNIKYFLLRRSSSRRPKVCLFFCPHQDYPHILAGMTWPLWHS